MWLGTTHLSRWISQFVTTGAKGTVAEDSDESAAKVPATAGTTKDLEVNMKARIPMSMIPLLFASGL